MGLDRAIRLGAPHPALRAAGRRGARFGRRGGGAAPWTPLLDAQRLIWWDISTLSAGAVSSWVDRVAGLNAAQAVGGSQPACSLTAIGSAYPGVTFDGTADFLSVNAGGVLSGKTTLTLTFAFLDTEIAVKVPLEYTANATTNNGGFFIAPNNTGTNMGGGVRGTTGPTARAVASETCAAVAVWSFGFDFATAGAGALSFIRKNGVAQTLANITTASAAGSAANSTLYIGARAGTSLWSACTFGSIVIRNGISTTDGLYSVEQYVGRQAGITILSDLGRVFTVGDSITRGLNADTGGWRKSMESQLAAAGVPWTAVGPYVTGSTGMTQKYHGGLNNDTTAARLAVISGQVTTAAPDVIVWGLGVNDIGSAAAPPRITPAEYLANMASLLDAADAAAPTVQHLVQTIVVPTGGSGLGYLPEYAAANAGLATLCAGRSRCTLVDVGAPVQSDGVHPVDGATGYDVMATAIVSALRALP